MEHCEMESPIGNLRLVCRRETLVAIEFGLDRIDSSRRGTGVSGFLGQAVNQLTEYFAGDRQNFDLPLAPEGTAFQKTVWNELARIPYGVTISYGQLAGRIGRASASRAVGAANGRNPLPIVLPCHRVIGAAGQLTGYAGGLEIKRWLLIHEGELLA